MSTESARSIAAFASILVMALLLRTIGLERVQPSFDELHYRQDMLNIPGWVGQGRFREHSVRHNHGNAPHGLLSQWLSHTIGINALKAAGPLAPESVASRENFFSRLSNALLSTLSVALLYLIARELFERRAALAVTLLAALSPILVLFGRTEYLDTPQAFFALISVWALWRAINAQGKLTLAAAAAAAGAGCGFALGAKWSTLYLVPFVPPIFWVARRRARETALFTLAFLAVFLLSQSIFHSIESWKWVLFPDPTDQYGDPIYEQGLASMLKLNLWHLLRWENVASIGLVWGGLALPVLFYGSARGWLAARKIKGAFLRRDLFLACLVALGVIFNFMQGGDYTAWRACFPALLLILATGAFLERLSTAQLAAAMVALVVTTLPLSLHQGLRLGPAVVKYYGSQHTYFSKRTECQSDLACDYENY